MVVVVEAGSNETASYFDFNLTLIICHPKCSNRFQVIQDFMSNIEWWMIVCLFWELCCDCDCYGHILGKNGLIIGAKLADEGAQKLTFGELFSSAMKYFWRVFGFSLLTGLAMFVVIMVSCCQSYFWG